MNDIQNCPHDKKFCREDLIEIVKDPRVVISSGSTIDVINDICNMRIDVDYLIMIYDEVQTLLRNCYVVLFY